MIKATLSSCVPNPISSSFREDAPRPPVPGEEGETKCYSPSKLAMMRPKNTAKSSVVAPPGSTARRDDDGLGEPEGSASPDSPLARWTKSLHSLLGDQDGAQLFRAFLEREKCVDTLDFWFACNGFRQMDLKDTKTLRVAKAIYKRYIENNSVVAKQLKPATKTFIRDNIKRQQIDSAMFDQAQTEIQTTMEENAYQMFLTSDIYLEYVRSGCENPTHVNPNGLGSLKLVCGYLPTLNEEEEWSCNDIKAKALATVVGLSTKALRTTPSLRTMEVLDNGYRHYRRTDPAHPYHVTSGYSFAPATSANDSEISSDAMTDDSTSMTDSSVDAIPPYKLGSKKHLQREIHRNLRMNGQVTLPHFPRTHRPPKEMTPVEPAVFAAELIARLERLKREQDTISSLEERLQQIQEEEERDDSEVPGSATHSLPLLTPGSCEEDPQAILDEHLSRVLKTPGCQSPGMVRHSPRSRSPDQRLLTRGGPVTKPLPSSSLGAFVPGKTFISRQSTKHIHHHYIHHHTGLKSKEQIEAEATQRVQCLCPGSAECCPTYTRSRSLGREQCGSPAEMSFGTQSTKKSYGSDSARVHTWGGGGSGGHLRAHQPAHPFVQDPAMPPLPPPNTLAQLEEACRRLEEVSKPPKQRHSTSSLQRDKSHPVPVQNGTSSFLSPGLQTEELKEPKKQAGSHVSLGSETVITYFFCGEEIPYRRMMKTQCLTLGHFKEQLRKKGNYRYYFKRASDEFECGAVFEEICDDGTVLPMYEGKILGKVERMD
ncbi:axin-2 isoform X2 [Chanos chanos]|uniref:Axin-2 isoform X2 n=1 Tax=Chanos chanos TaxID=29144 RepID=A0A6J2WLE2_CHACN|nr:axin-2-like isoform X2 [Chanos chanos]